AELGRARIRPVLFNDAVDLGGRARTECRAGFHLNLGPHRLYERGAAVAGLRQLDITIDSAARGPNGGVAIRGGVTHTQPGGCFSLLSTGPLRLSPQRGFGTFLAGVPSLDVSAFQSVPVAEWLETSVRDPCVLQFALALIRFTTYCDEPERLSAAAAVEQLKLSLMGSVLYIHQGWGTLVAALR